MTKTVIYPATFEPTDDNWFVVTFRDVPEAITQGSTYDEAVDMAKDALKMALEDYPILPLPSLLKDGDVEISVEVK